MSLESPLRLPGRHRGDGCHSWAFSLSREPGPGEPGPTEAFVVGQVLLERIAAGDRAAREEFVTQYERLIRHSISTALRQRDTALTVEEVDDLVQTILLSFFDRDCRKLRMYEGRNQASFATFIRVCATRQTLDHLRSLRRRLPMADDPNEDDEVRGQVASIVDPGPGPERSAVAAQHLERLRAAVMTLPLREQLLVRLHLIEGAEAAEVARILGISDNAVHVLKSRVKSKLREQIDLGSDHDE